jgi:type 1 fimbriae regulatory protein FimE
VAKTKAESGDCRSSSIRFAPLTHRSHSSGSRAPRSTSSKSGGSARCARFAFPVHAYRLRHACGYALANAGHDTRRIQDWLGHRSIQHTVRYTELSPTRFRDFWRD